MSLSIYAIWKSGRASGFRAGLEKARDICITAAEAYEQQARNASTKLVKELSEVRADENRGNAAQIQREIEK